MHFIRATNINGGKTLINTATISQIFEFKKNHTRILFCFEICNDYAYEDVKESMAEIFHQLN